VGRRGAAGRDGEEKREIGRPQLDFSATAATSSVAMPNNKPSDHDLVARVLRGDRDAFGHLYDRYARLVRAVLHGETRGHHVVQDLTQECFLRAYKNLSRLRQPDRFGAWIVGIARQLAREHRRALRRDRHRFVAGDAIEVCSESGSTEAVRVAEEIELAIRRLAELPERERLAIHAFFLQGRDAGQTAALLGLSRSGVYALLGRAMARLADNIRGNGKGVE
jgi:RNA polymerase sigma-70 factor (ECF subfamily)